MLPSRNCCLAGGTWGGRWGGNLASCWKRNVRRRHFVSTLIYSACSFMFPGHYIHRKKPEKTLPPQSQPRQLDSSSKQLFPWKILFALRKIFKWPCSSLLLAPHHSCPNHQNSTFHCLTFEELRERGL